MFPFWNFSYRHAASWLLLADGCSRCLFYESSRQKIGFLWVEAELVTKLLSWTEASLLCCDINLNQSCCTNWQKKSEFVIDKSHFAWTVTWDKRWSDVGQNGSCCAVWFFVCRSEHYFAWNWWQWQWEGQQGAGWKTRIWVVKFSWSVLFSHLKSGQESFSWNQLQWHWVLQVFSCGVSSSCSSPFADWTPSFGWNRRQRQRRGTAWCSDVDQV